MSVRNCQTLASIVATVFRSELVPQHPNNEPPSVLPGCIRAKWGIAPTSQRRGARTNT